MLLFGIHAVPKNFFTDYDLFIVPTQVACSSTPFSTSQDMIASRFVDPTFFDVKDVNFEAVMRRMNQHRS